MSLEELRRTVIVSTLRTTRLFGGLPSEDLSEVAAITTVKPLAKGEYLFRQGQPARGFYIVQKGAVSVHRVTPTGKEQVICVFRAGESFAEAALVSPGGYPADARAVEASQVLLVEKEGFLALLRRHPELGLRMLASMSLHLRTLVGQLEDLALKDVETRLANWLLKRCPAASDQPVTIQLDVTKRVLASELGTVSETLSRTFARFRRDRLALVKGRTITIPNPARLRQLLLQRLGEPAPAGDLETEPRGRRMHAVALDTPCAQP
ncbi:Crp/Fnr family transcriptional regulator [Limisphaera sp. VF-2]|uniref:Crp/Fnr family transcriptional regulator n=1 Tax=Limisphaera sp. VF-2 TaxID=3400418 RepID=UPI002564168B|nr:Crp/Fnr family transcriptional regulator [Limisphaera sp.]